MSDDTKIEIIEPPSVKERDTKGRFLTGNNGGGRKPGSRNKLAEEFIRSFAEDFEKHGYRVIAQVRQETPAIWLKIASDLLPKETAQKLDGSDLYADCETLDEIAVKMIESADWNVGQVLDAHDALRERFVSIAAERGIDLTPPEEPLTWEERQRERFAEYKRTGR